MFEGKISLVSWLFRACAVAACCIGIAAAELPAYRPGKIIVVPKAGAEAKLEKLRKGKRHKLWKKFERLGGIEVIETDKDAAAAAREYAASGLVDSAEPDYIIRASVLPNDPDLSRLWSFRSSTNAGVDMAAAWETRNSAEDVIVAVIDSGVRYTHEDLAANMWVNPNEVANGLDDDGNGIVDDIHGIDAVYNTGDPWDDAGHGTHVAGTIGAVANNGKGIAGVCWKVKIMAAKFMDWSGEGDTSDAIDCINYARRNGAKIINASWGSAYGSYALRSAITAARNSGIIFVTAAGNERQNNDLYASYPANYSMDNIVSVAATDSSGKLDAEYSNYGARTVDLAAPGTRIYSTWFTSDTAYVTISGTSMAAPHVAGAAALLRSAYPDENYRQTIARLYAATDKLPSLNGLCATGGRLNIGRLFPAAPATVVSNVPPQIVTNTPPAVASVGSIAAVELSAAGTLRIELAPSQSEWVVQSSTDLLEWTAIETSANSSFEAEAADKVRFFRAVPAEEAAGDNVTAESQ